MRKDLAIRLMASSVLAIWSTAPALAQEATPPSIAPSDPEQAAEDENVIVVTGTQIRGIAPAGVAVIGLNQKAIAESGATSGAELLAQVPQVANYFNSMPGVGGNSAQFVNRSVTSRPNLRGLPNANVVNAPFTLVLVDGHRMVPAGISSAAGFDPDSIPPALVQRVEIMPDGASAIYGSEAVAGVINYITKSKFEGAEIGGHFGISEGGYSTADINGTAGVAWNSGNAFVNVNWARHDALYGRDLDYIRNIAYNPASTQFGLAGAGCFPGSILIPAAPYTGQYFPISASGPAASAGVRGGNRCDISDNLSVVPELETIGVMVGLNQTLTDSLKFDVRGWWQRRSSISNAGYFASPSPFVGAILINTTSPFNFNPPGVAPNPSTANGLYTQTLNIDLSSFLGREGRVRTTDVDWWQVTPRLSWDVGAGWQVRALYSHGASKSVGTGRDLNTTAVTNAITAGTFNPFTLTGSASPASFISTTNRRGDYTMNDVSMTADGPLFRLPGGEVRVAFGASHNKLAYDLNVPGTIAHDDQRVTAVFGEIQVPIFGEGNATPGFHSLLLSASVRHDRYGFSGKSNANSYAGNYRTTNPSIGLTWAPVDWVKVRGNWSTSFTAPNGMDRVVIPALTVQNPAASDPNLPVSAAAWPFGTSVETTAAMGPNAINAISLTLSGGAADQLRPQTSKNWSVGFDVTPPFLDGLSGSFTFFSIKIKDLLASPGGTTGAPSIVQNYPALVYTNGGAPLTAAQIQAYVAQTSGLNSAGQPEYATAANSQVGGQTFLNCSQVTLTCPVAYILDNRNRNLANLAVKGLDFSVRYEKAQSWGSWDLSIAGTRNIKLTQVAGVARTDLLRFNYPKWKWSASAGAEVGRFRARATWKHQDGFAIDPGNATTAPYGTQTWLSGYDQLDLFFRYDLGGLGFVEKVAVTLNINNVTNAKPVAYNSDQATFPGIFNGDGGFVLTPGRFWQLGITTSF